MIGGSFQIFDTSWIMSPRYIRKFEPPPSPRTPCIPSSLTATCTGPQRRVGARKDHEGIAGGCELSVEPTGGGEGGRQSIGLYSPPACLMLVFVWLVTMDVLVSDICYRWRLFCLTTRTVRREGGGGLETNGREEGLAMEVLAWCSSWLGIYWLVLFHVVQIWGCIPGM